MQIIRNVPEQRATPPTINGRPAPIDMRASTLLARALNGDTSSLEALPQYVPVKQAAAPASGFDHNQARAYMDHVEMTANSLIAAGVGRELGLTFADLRKLPLPRLMALQAEQEAKASHPRDPQGEFRGYDLNALADTLQGGRYDDLPP